MTKARSICTGIKNANMGNHELQKDHLSLINFQQFPKKFIQLEMDKCYVNN